MTEQVVIQEVTETVVVVTETALGILELVSDGPQGPRGFTATVAIGTINSVSNTTPAAVRNVGTNTQAVLEFDIPRGNDGDVTPAVQALVNAAQASATAAEDSASSAFDAAVSASASSGNASTAATAAASSASSAQTYLTQVGLDAGAAAQSATSAEAAKTAAQGSQTAAATSATNAAASATAAATSQTSASTSAATATTQANIATTKAGEAATSATGAATSATTATTKAAEALANATAAATAKSAAEAARDQTLAAFDSFDDRYLGQKASDPTVDNDGNALTGGALYFNTNPLASGGGMKVYDGTNLVWVAAYASLTGALMTANNLSDLGSASAARTNLGLGNVENKSSATILGELTSGNVTTALGFTPYNATNPSGFVTAAALSGYLTSASAASTYQPVDGDLTAIAALAGTSGLLKKTAANTWTLDTSSYLTGITSGQVTTALGFTPYNETNPSGYITAAALASYLPIAGGTLTGGLTVGADLLFTANAGAARTIGMASGTNTSLVIQAGATTGSGANLELTAAKFAYLDADEFRARSNDGVTAFAVFNSAGVSIGATSPTGYGKLLVRGQEAGTGTSTIAAVTTGAAQGERTDLAMYATFVGTGDNGVRRVADIVSGFTGAWGTEYLALHVGNGGASNDTKLLTTEVVRLTRFGAGVTGTLSATGAITQNGMQVLHTGNYDTYLKRVVPIASATSITMNADTTDTATQANTQADGTLTINAPTGTPVDGQKLLLRISCTNVQTLSFNAVFRGSTDQPLPTVSSGAGKEDYLGFIYDSVATKWDLIAKNFGF